jgi:polysaccharide export outer membrane protein
MGAQPATAGSPASPGRIASASSPSDYRIQPLDTIQINVFNEAELSIKSRVSAQGMINYPLLGAVRVGGLTVSEAENLLKERLGRDFLVNPQVSVLVDRANSRRVFILGQVKSPGAIEFSADEALTLLQAIARAGGFTPVAAPGRVSIIRSEDGAEKNITVNVTAIINSGDRSKDIELKSDDVVSVPESIF